jgi:hypothetical protein
VARSLLNDLRIRSAKPRSKAYRLADGDGLYLFVPSSGASASDGARDGASAGRNQLSLGSQGFESAAWRADWLAFARLPCPSDWLSAVATDQ